MGLKYSAAERRSQIYHDDLDLMQLAIAPPELVMDLFEIAKAAFLADRSTRRGDSADGAAALGSWSRRLHLVVQVRQQAFWRRPDVETQLLELLNWLTEDDWSLSLEPTDRRDVVPQALFPPEPPDEVALFSGGLDSVAGAALRLQQGANVLGVSVQSNARMGGFQSRSARQLNAASDGQFRRVKVEVHRICAPKHENPWRRTRGLLFLSAGLMAVAASDRERLLVFENGPGAINLPYVEGQSGAMTSRSVHPQTLELFAHLASLVLDRDFDVLNPFVSKTKAQMVSALEPRFAGAAGLSESCDTSASARSPLRCGRCTSCLLRRQAFYAASRSDWDRTGYGQDVLDGADPGRLPEMLWQAGRLERALDASSPGLALRLEFPELAAIPAGVGLDERAVHRLYRTYVQEWVTFPHNLVRAHLAGHSSERLTA